MLRYKYKQSIPVNELEAELRALARELQKVGFEQLSALEISFQPWRDGVPAQLGWPGPPREPVSLVTIEGRLASSRSKMRTRK